MDDVDNITEAFPYWLDSQNEGWWDDVADACQFESSLREAFKAGYDACLADHP